MTSGEGIKSHIEVAGARPSLPGREVLWRFNPLAGIIENFRLLYLAASSIGSRWQSQP
jgi:hypothetical protein